MDMQSIVQALRGMGGGQPPQMDPMAGGQSPQMTPPPQQGGGGNPLNSGIIAVSPEYQKYRHEAMLNGESPLPPEQWMVSQGMGQ